MGVSHGRSRVADLTFQVYQRAIHPDWFAVRQFRRITHRRWEVDLRVVEWGHAISFRAGPVRITEVLAGPETRLPADGILFHSPLKHERSAKLSPAPQVEYYTCFEVERVDPEVFAHLSDEMTLDASPGRLLHHFRPADRLSPAPITHVQFEGRNRGVTVYSFHTFPEEHAVVRTQTLFEWR